MAPGLRHRRMAKPLRRGPRGRSVAGDRRHEVGDLFGFLALIELRRHLSEAARAAFCDRVEHERPAPGGGGDVVSYPYVQIRAGAAARLGPDERMTHRAGAREEFAPTLLLGVQVDAADADACLVLAVGPQHEG